MNKRLKLWTAIIKEAGSTYAETYGLLSNQHDGFRFLRIIHEALASLIMMMEDAKNSSKNNYIMYADFEGEFNGTNHRMTFKHVLKLDIPPHSPPHANNSTASPPQIFYYPI
jgi:hypothetical protein